MEQQQDGSFWNEFETDARTSGECTVIDFCEQLLPQEYQLELFKHEQEWDNINQKLRYRLTNEGKKSVLSDELDLTIRYLENEEQGEFRQIFGDLSQTKLDKAIDKVKVMAQIIQTSTIWKEMSHKEKVQFLAIRNLRSDIISANMPFKQSYRILLEKIGLRILTDKEKAKAKTNKSTLNRQVIDFINSLFYDHFQVELNKRIQDELQKFIPAEEYLSKEIIESSNEVSLPQIEWQGTQKELAELFLELNRKGFIPDIPIKLIKQYFTKSNSIDQVLKPNQDPKTKDNIYEGIYTPAYRPRFDSIRQKS